MSSISLKLLPRINPYIIMYVDEFRSLYVLLASYFYAPPTR
jgi:hypothetical protein